MVNDSSDSTDAGSAQAKSTKRKPTYLVRKEEARALTRELQTLRDKLSLLGGANEDVESTFKHAKTENQLLKHAVENQQLAMASVASMLTEQIQTPRDNPIYTHVHLPKRSSARRAALMAMKDDKLQRAYRYLAARSCHFDLTKPRSSMDCIEESDGTFACHCFDVTQFQGAHSLKQVFDALVFYVFNVETNVSEKTGDVIIREDYDNLNDGAHILNHRITSNHESGETTEVNAVAYAQYFEGPNALQDHPCAILATDSVDEDDLHPYDPQHRIRRDLTAAVVLTWERQRRPTDSSRSSSVDDELVVVMRRVAFIKVYRPEFDVPGEVLADLHEGIAKWPAVMLQAVRESLLGRR